MFKFNLYQVDGLRYRFTERTLMAGITLSGKWEISFQVKFHANNYFKFCNDEKLTKPVLLSMKSIQTSGNEVQLVRLIVKDLLELELGGNLENPEQKQSAFNYNHQHSIQVSKSLLLYFNPFRSNSKIEN